MANDTNTIIMTGNLGDDPKIRYGEGAANATISIACNRYIPTDDHDADGNRIYNKETNWAHIVAWGALAERVDDLALNKGDKVLIQGRWHSTQWTDTSGQKRYGTEIVAESIALQRRVGQTAEPDAPVQPTTAQPAPQRPAKATPPYRQQPTRPQPTKQRQGIAPVSKRDKPV